ncbi:MAG: hypothetical protein ABI551_24985 [Polyangiaceae bacterium]
MRILVFDEHPSERGLLVHALTNERDVVESAADSGELAAKLASTTYDIVFVGWSGRSEADTLRSVRAKQPACTLVALVETGAEMLDLSDAGANELLHRPLMPEEISARLRTIAALRASARPRPSLDRLSSWGLLGASAAEQIEELAGWKATTMHPLSCSPPEASHIGALVLSLPREEAEVHVKLVADVAAERLLARRLLLDSCAPRDQCDDMLRELANVLGAAVKRMLTAVHVEAVVGLPTNAPSANIPARSSRAWRLSRDFFLAFVVEVHSRCNLRLPASALVEGMVLVDDLRSEAGTVLVAAGTCLTSTTAERIRSIVGSLTLVEVAEVDVDAP